MNILQLYNFMGFFLHVGIIYHILKTIKYNFLISAFDTVSRVLYISQHLIIVIRRNPDLDVL